MQLEVIGDTYKITLGRAEQPLLPDEDSGLHGFLTELTVRLKTEKDVMLPDGQLIAEIFTHADGSRTVFISALPRRRASERDSYAAVDVAGIDKLTALCRALAKLRARCTVYCGDTAQCYRLVFRNPSANIARVCAEFGDYSEITQLFAAQTEEYLKKITTKPSDLK